MKQYTVAVLGATGAVGQEMIKILQERDFPVGKLIPLASARSAGKTLKFKGEDVVIREAKDDAFAGVDIVLGAAENDIAKQFAPAIVAAGAVFVDNSSAFRMDPKVPLIVPEVNPEDVAWHNGIISNPNCSTIITITAVNALNASEYEIHAPLYQTVFKIIFPRSPFRKLLRSQKTFLFKFLLWKRRKKERILMSLEHAVKKLYTIPVKIERYSLPCCLSRSCGI